MRLISSLLLASTLALALAHCAKRTNNPETSPRIPPAEEPSDDTPGAFAADAGAPK